MAFVQTKYEANNGEIYGIRLETLTAGAAGGAPAGAVTQPQNVQVSKGNREFGIRPRGVRLKRNAGTALVPSYRYKFLPVLTIAGAALAGFQKGATIQIGGTDWDVTAIIPEDY